MTSRRQKYHLQSCRRILLDLLIRMGGELIIGMTDPRGQKPTIKGLQSSEDYNDHIQVLLADTKPSVEGTNIELVDFGEEGWIMRVIIPKSPQVHYASDDKCYVRRNASTRQVKGDDIAKLTHSKGSFSYERVSVNHITAEDLIESVLVNKYLDSIGSTLDPLQYLRKNRFVVKDESGKWSPTVAAVLLFDPEPQATLDTRCAIKVYRLHTTEPEYKREHLKEQPTTVEGTVLDQIDSSLASVSSLLESAKVEVGGRLRKARYPLEAIKEIVVNAVLHRDYS